MTDNTKPTPQNVAMFTLQGMGRLFWTAQDFPLCSDYCYLDNNRTCSLWVSGKMPRLLKVAALESYSRFSAKLLLIHCAYFPEKDHCKKPHTGTQKCTNIYFLTKYKP